FARDLFEWSRKDRLHQRVGDLPHRLLARPTIELLRTPVPIADHILHVPHEYGVVGEIEQARLLLEAVLRLPTCRDVEHHAAQAAALIVFDDHADQIPEPYDS